MMRLTFIHTSTKDVWCIIEKALNMSLRAEYHHYDYVPYVSNLSIKEIRPL